MVKKIQNFPFETSFTLQIVLTLCTRVYFVATAGPVVYLSFWITLIFKWEKKTNSIRIQQNEFMNPKEIRKTFLTVFLQMKRMKHVHWTVEKEWAEIIVTLSRILPIQANTKAVEFSGFFFLFYSQSVWCSFMCVHHKVYFFFLLCVFIEMRPEIYSL